MLDFTDDPDGNGSIVDGRRQRTVKTRQAIISAVIALQEKSTADSAAPLRALDIATQAGVSLRSIFTHFPTQEAMTLAVMDELESRLMGSVAAAKPSGSFEIRLESFINNRVSLLEVLGPFRRSAVALNASPEVADRRRRVRRQLRKEIALVFSKELSQHKSGDVALNAVSIFCESESWHTLRHYYGLSAKAAKATFRMGIEKLLL